MSILNLTSFNLDLKCASTTSLLRQCRTSDSGKFYTKRYVLNVGIKYFSSLSLIGEQGAQMKYIGIVITTDIGYEELDCKYHSFSSKTEMGCIQTHSEMDSNLPG